MIATSPRREFYSQGTGWATYNGTSHGTCSSLQYSSDSTSTATWQSDEPVYTDYADGELEPEPEEVQTEEFVDASPGEHPVPEYLNPQENMPAWPWPSGFL